jgi:hypothetical protein
MDNIIYMKRQPADFSYLSGSATETAFSQSVEQLNANPHSGLMGYEMYVKKDRLGLWSARKELYYDYYNHTCQVCHQRRATQVHHLTYERCGKESIGDLMPICGTCHQKEHNLC